MLDVRRAFAFYLQGNQAFQAISIARENDKSTAISIMISVDLNFEIVSAASSVIVRTILHHCLATTVAYFMSISIPDIWNSSSVFTKYYAIAEACR